MPDTTGMPCTRTPRAMRRLHEQAPRATRGVAVIQRLWKKGQSGHPVAAVEDRRARRGAMVETRKRVRGLFLLVSDGGCGRRRLQVRDLVDQREEHRDDDGRLECLSEDLCASADVSEWRTKKSRRRTMKKMGTLKTSGIANLCLPT